MEPYKSKTAFLIVLSLLVAALVSPPVGACDWPNWRGPDYNGISGESDWNASWPDSGPKVLWKASIGTGFSSISVSNGKAYATGNTASKKDKSKGENDIIFCFDAETGEEIWSYKYANQLDPKYYEGGTLATPTVSGGKVYNVSKDGKTFCLDADTGKVVWQADLLADFGVERPKWGISGSPFVINKMVIFNAGSAGLALNKEDGSLIWKSSAGPGGYSTAMPFTIDGKKCIVLAGMKDILALDAKSGKELWRFGWETKYDVNAADPIVSGDKMFISSGYDHGSALLKISANSAEQIWQNKNIRNKMNPCVLWEGFVYGTDEKGELRCLDMGTGEIKWAQEGFGQGGVTIAGDKLIVLGEKGNLAVAELTADGYKPISEAEVLTGRCWAAPVMANGRIYARNAEGDLVCLDVKAD